MNLTNSEAKTEEVSVTREQEKGLQRLMIEIWTVEILRLEMCKQIECKVNACHVAMMTLRLKKRSCDCMVVKFSSLDPPDKLGCVK